jgi:hypothetical protein
MRTLLVKTSAILVLSTAVFVAPSAMYGQTSDPIPASKGITARYGVASYRLNEGTTSFTLEAIAVDGRTVFTTRWTGASTTDDVSVTVVKDGNSLGITCSKVDGSSDCVAFENSRPSAVQDLSDVSRGLATELNDYLGDVFGNAAAKDCTVATTSIVAKRSGLRFPGLAEKQISDRGRRVMNGICYVAGICTGFWPIGTLICGPTAVGCAVYYFTAS